MLAVKQEPYIQLFNSALFASLHGKWSTNKEEESPCVPVVGWSDIFRRCLLHATLLAQKSMNQAVSGDSEAQEMCGGVLRLTDPRTMGFHKASRALFVTTFCRYACLGTPRMCCPTLRTEHCSVELARVNILKCMKRKFRCFQSESEIAEGP